MKTIKKFLAFAPLLLLSYQLFAPIIPIKPNNTSQLAPVDPIIFPPLTNDKILSLQNAAGKEVNFLNRTSYQDQFICDQPTLIVSSPTILNSLLIPQGNIPTIVLPELSDDSIVYYFSNIILDDPSISLQDFLDQSLVKSFYAENQNRQGTIIIDNLTMADGSSTTVAIADHSLLFTDTQVEPGWTGSLTSTKNKLKINYFPDVEPRFSWNSIAHFLADWLCKGRSQAFEEKLNVQHMLNIDSALKEKTALNVLERLKGISNAQLSTNDQSTIWDAVQSAIINNDGKALSGDFLLDFSSLELEALCNTISFYGINISQTNPLYDAIISSLETAQLEQNRRSLQETLADKVSLGDTAIVDWYITLSFDDQILIKYEFNAAVEEGTLLSQDPETLNAIERIMLENYINETLSLAIAPTQIADLQAKLKAVTQPQDPARYTAYLQEKLKTLSAPKQQDALIDWLSTLSLEDQNSIALDVQAILLTAAFNTLDNQSTAILFSKNKNILEIFKLKQNFESFLLSTDERKNSILDAAYRNYGLSNQDSLASITSQQKIEKFIQFCDVTINKLFLKYMKNNMATCLDPSSQDPYAQAFRTLSISEQSTIINTFQNSSLINANLERLNAEEVTEFNSETTIVFNFFQDAILPDRINAAQTTADLDTIVSEAQDAGLAFSPEGNAALKAKYKSIEAAENRAIAEHVPFAPDNTHTVLNLDPLIVDPITGKNETVNINKDPQGGQTPTDTNPVISSPTEYDNDPELKEESEKIIDEEKQRADADEAKNKANEEARAEGRTEREV